MVSIMLVFSSSCGYLMCGEHELKHIVDEINATYEGIQVEIIPCEYNYINVYAKKSEIDTATLIEIHQRLYNKNEKRGWHILKIYSKERTYAFSLLYPDKVFLREED